MTRNGNGREISLTEPIWEGEVITVLEQHNRGGSVGADNIDAGILLRNKEWLSPLFADALKAGKYNNMANAEWIHRIATFLRKNKDPLNIDNYRPISPINVIYEILACIFGNRLTTLINLLTDEENIIQTE